MIVPGTLMRFRVQEFGNAENAIQPGTTGMISFGISCGGSGGPAEKHG